MAKRSTENSRFKDYLPACVKCGNYLPNISLDPFDTETKCSRFGEIPERYLLMDEACDKLSVESGKALISVGDRPLTMLERWAIDDEQLSEIYKNKK